MENDEIFTYDATLFRGALARTAEAEHAVRKALDGPGLLLKDQHGNDIGRLRSVKRVDGDLIGTFEIDDDATVAQVLEGSRISPGYTVKVDP